MLMSLMEAPQLESESIQRRNSPQEELLVKYDIDGNTPMTLAIKKKSAAAITALLDYGVDVDHCNDRKESLMHIACAEGSMDIVELLISVRKKFRVAVPDMHP